ncbi:MAG: hypothetical protein ACE5E4_08325 [Candidatus Binatia bacterium]
MSRVIKIHDGGVMSADGLFSEQLCMQAAASMTGDALVLLWRREEPAVGVGRFHRVPERASRIERRLTGGRCISVGPGVLGMTSVLASTAWLGGSGQLRPEQFLNRALRPLLSTLRDLGVDAFYPGRDLITVGGRALAHASFSVAPDGVFIMEAHLGLQHRISDFAQLLAEVDGSGVVSTSADPLAGAVALGELLTLPAGDLWPVLLAEACERVFACVVDAGGARWPKAGLVANAAAFTAFQTESGPVPGGHAVASAFGQLGVVDCSARVEDCRLRGLRINGDIIAPFHTIDELCDRLEGHELCEAALRAEVAEVLARPGNFVLGAPDLAGLISRLAC